MANEQLKTLSNIVDAIINERRNNPSCDTSSLENQIDQLVYSLYNLTPEEIAIIEQ